MDPHAQPPVTLEGWYALHQVFALDRGRVSELREPERCAARCAAGECLAAVATPACGGWSAVVRLVGSLADVLVIHFRPTLDDLGEVQEQVARLELARWLRPVFSFLSMTEVTLYHLPGRPGDPLHDARLDAERDSPHARRRLFPVLPEAMPYVSFYPTSKRREAGQNWYTLSLPERSALMKGHGQTGHRHAGRVRQIITGAIGLDAWEWGVTLFAADPREFKRVVTDMRYDEASARYADFGDFWVGRVVEPRQWAQSLGD